MNTNRSKRWNGNLDTLTPEYLKDVIERMQAYGDRVQFELPGKGQRPNYQVINASEKKMAFDSKNLLTSLNSDGNVSETLSSVFTLDQVKAAITHRGVKAAAKARTPRASSTPGARPITAAAQAADTIERDKYAYFKEHRDVLPEGITHYSEKISELMHSGMPAEQAFEAIIKQYF